MNNVFCNYISRSSLCAENESDWLFGFVACLNIQIFINDVQSIQLLAFVLMQTFDLNVEDAVFVNFDTGIFQNKVFAYFLRICFDFKKCI